MNKLKTTLLIAIIAIGFTQFASAQKVAHINIEEVIASMPETKAMAAEIEKIGRTYESEIKTFSETLNAKYTKYGQEQASQTPEVNKLRSEEIQKENAKLQQMQVAARQDLQKKENELLAPIVKKVEDAIKAYAKEKGIQYVLDARTLVYSEGGEDIAPAIKTKLGVQ